VNVIKVYAGRFLRTPIRIIFPYL